MKRHLPFAVLLILCSLLCFRSGGHAFALTETEKPRVTKEMLQKQLSDMKPNCGMRSRTKTRSHSKCIWEPTPQWSTAMAWPGRT